MTLDHQQRFFTGWGSSPTNNDNLKTPSLGLVWANQIACRIALIKESASGKVRAAGDGVEGSADWTPRRWRRYMRVAFSAWAPPTADNEPGIEIEVWAGGLRATKEARNDGDGLGPEGRERKAGV